MKSIKLKMILGFAVPAVVIGSLTIWLLSWKISDSTLQQSHLLSEDLRVQTNSVLNSHNKLLKSIVGDIGTDVSRTAEGISKDHDVFINLESQHLNVLEGILKTTSEDAEIDFALIFDADGNLQSSYPTDVSVLKAEEFYKSFKLNSQAQDGFDIVFRCSSEFLNAFELDSEDIFGKGGIVVASAKFILDDFGDMFGGCVTGKILNRYDKPLKQLHDIIGSVCVLYLENIPIAQAGFEIKDDSDRAAFRISPDILSKIYDADEAVNVTLTFAGKKYLTACYAIKSFSGDKIGVICVGLPEAQIIQTQHSVAQSNSRNKTIS